MKLNLIFYLLWFVALCSCNSDYGESFEKEELTAFDDPNVMRIDRDKSTLDADDAQSVALMFFNKGKKIQTKASQSMSVVTYSDSISGNPLLYVVNFGNDNGFALISATKKSTPILAFSDKGNFDCSGNSAAEIYLEDYQNVIREAYLDKSDTLRLKYALQWASFEKKSPITKSISYELSQKIQAEVQRKEALGYEHLGNITAAQYFLPASDYQALLQQMQDITDPQYDYTELNQFFIKSYDYETIGPLLQTEWGQYAPFNIGAPNLVAGCVPIAISQLVYYYRYPNRYYWNDIPIVPAENYDNSNFIYFMNDIRDICNPEYEKETIVSKEKAENALSALGYTVTKKGEINILTMHSQLSISKPMMLFGKINGNNGHTWICDGYMDRRYDASISFVPAANDPRFKLDKIPGSIFAEFDLTAYSPSWLDQNQFGEYLHMNMGWDGDNNGWYKNGVYGKNTDNEVYNSNLDSWIINKN